MKPILFLPLSIVLAVIAIVASAQDDGGTPKPNDARIEELTKQLNDQISELREAMRAAQTAGHQYLNAENYSDAFPYTDEFYKKIEEGNAIREKIVPVAIELFELKVAGTDRAPDELAHLLSNVMEHLYKRGEYSRAYRLCKQLVVNNPDNEFANVFLARSGLLNNDFSPRIQAIVKKHRDVFDENEQITKTEKLLVLNIKLMQQLLEQELKIREAEAKADDLPRVKIKTTKGDFVIELFENEAPLTVANFISLVEAGHYDGLIFHTVISQTAAETGIFTETGAIRRLDYTIYDEFSKPNARKNFAGSVSLNSDKPNSGASRFFVSLAPLPNFNNTQTVFGRVLTGMDTVYRINHTYKIDDKTQIKIEDAKPDKVISAEVIRKRDHEYRPTKVEK